MQAMILAAGIGSRLQPITNTIPKPLIRVNGHTMLESTIQHLKNNGVTKIIVNVHHHAGKIVDYIKANNAFDVDIAISDESDGLRNTGGGIVYASRFFNADAPVIVSASDILTNLSIKDMMDYHKEKEALVTLAVKKRKTSRNLLFDAAFQLAGWRDNRSGEVKNVKGKDAEKELAFSGIHIIEPNFFKMVISAGNFNIIDEYLQLAQKNKIIGFNHSCDQWIEFGRINSLEQAKNNPQVTQLQSQLFESTS